MELLRKGIYHISAGLFCSILVLLGVSVFCRYALNNSIVWSEEVIRFGFIWMFFLSMGEVSRTGSHLALDLLPGLLRGASKKYLGILIEVLNILFFIVLAYYGTKVGWANMAQRSPALLIPYGTIYLAIPVGSLIMALFSVQRIRDIARTPAATRVGSVPAAHEGGK